MHTNRIPNPLTLAFSLIEGYKTALKRILSLSIEDKNDIEKICKSITVDHDLLISLNNKYKSSKTDLYDFQKKYNNQISERIISNIYNSFVSKSERKDQTSEAQNYFLYVHQEKVIKHILNGKNIILASGTGSGKTESFLIPILSYCDLNKSLEGIKAILVYPMNALANDQLDRIAKYTEGTDIKYGSFIGSTPHTANDVSKEKRLKFPNQIHSREEIIDTPPDILITNYVMLDWILTDPERNKMFLDSANSLKYLVLDEIHTYKGSKAAHLKFLLRRLKYFFNNEIIHIGTSATLKNKNKNIEGAYLYSEEGDKVLSEFVTSLFDIPKEKYELIEPTLVSPITSKDTDKKYDLSHVNKYPKEKFGWSLDLEGKNVEKFAELISLITNTKITKSDLLSDKIEEKVYELLRKSKFIHTLIERLSTHGNSSGGSQFFLKEIVPLLDEVDETLREEVAKTIFSIILYLNHLNKNNPFLDFKIHLFLKNVGGNLKKCIKCETYHSGKQKFCNVCGSPLFNVYKKDIDKCIGKVTREKETSGWKLKSQLFKESDDDKNTYYVLISKNSEIHEGVNINTSFKSMDEDFGIEHNNNSEINLQEFVLPYTNNKIATGYDQILEYLVSLTDTKSDDQYVVEITTQILDFKQNDKKLLAFCDSKEKVSRFSMILRDEFISNFFEEYVKFILSSEPFENLSITRMFQLVHNTILNKPLNSPYSNDVNLYYEELEKIEKYSQTEKEIFKDFPLWFYRYISEKNARRKELLSLNASNNLISEEERKLLKILINNRWIYKPLNNLNSKGNFIKFRAYLAWVNYGFHLDPSKKISKEGILYSYSLSKESQKEKEFVINTEFLRDADNILQKLLDERIILKVTLSEDKVVEANEGSEKYIYTLNPEKVFINVPKSEYNSLSELKKEKLLFAAYHSSEMKSHEREKTENEFRANKINVVIATPTLELGIDIGKLREVFMIGVPPLPSNYAQRAGRAGRGNENNFALIVTFCDENSNHDMYYFREPKEIIEGVITPPSFDADNENIIQKHLSAFLFGEYSKTKDELINLFNNIEPRSEEFISKTDYLLKGINNESSFNLRGIINKIKNTINKIEGVPRNYFYSNSIFPDYEFSKDLAVYAFLKEDKEKIEKRISENKFLLEGKTLADFALSEAEPEIASYKFVPRERVFLAGSQYKFTASGIYKNYESEKFVRRYQAFYVEEENSPLKSYFKNNYDRFVSYTSNSAAKSIGKVIEVGTEIKSKITFNNYGRLEFYSANAIPFNDETLNENFIIKYEIERNILILKFDTLFSSNDVYVYSFIGALYRALISIYKLDEMELTITEAYENIKSKEDIKNETKSIIVYDKSGAQNINFNDVVGNIENIFNYAYSTLTKCECENGCPLCMKSYTTYKFSHLMNKQVAIHIMGYLSGKTKFNPAPLIKTKKTEKYDTVIKINKKGGEIEAIYNKTKNYKPSENEKKGVGQNGIFFRLLRRIILDDSVNNSEGLLIKSNTSTIVNAINGTNEIKKDKNEFIRLQLQLLRYKKVLAKKI